MGQESDWSEFLAAYQEKHGAPLRDDTIPRAAFGKARVAAVRAFEEAATEGLDAGQMASLREETDSARKALPDIDTFLMTGDAVGIAGWNHSNVATQCRSTEGDYDFALHGAYVDAHWQALVEEVPALKEFEQFQYEKAHARSLVTAEHGAENNRRLAEELRILGYPGEDVSVRGWAHHVAKEVGFKKPKENLVGWLETMGFDRSSGDTVQTWLDKIGFDPGKGVSLEDFMKERGARSTEEVRR